MNTAKQTTPREMIVIGALFAAVGGYFILVGGGILPVPGGERNLHGPLWIVVCAGLAFFLGGAAALIQGIGGANASGELPKGAPAWMRVIQYLMGVSIFICFALLGSWIAFGGEARSFSGLVPVFDAETNAGIGRTAFGIGAVITWLGTIAYAVSGARKLMRGAR